MACETRNGLRVRRKSNSVLVTRRVSRYSNKPKKKRTVAVTPTTQRQVISANVNEGRRNAARNPSAVGEIGTPAKHTSKHVIVTAAARDDAAEAGSLDAF